MKKVFKVIVVGGCKVANKFNRSAKSFKEKQRQEVVCITEKAAHEVMKSQISGMQGVHAIIMANIQEVDVINDVVMEFGNNIHSFDSQTA